MPTETMTAFNLFKNVKRTCKMKRAFPIIPVVVLCLAGFIGCQPQPKSQQDVHAEDAHDHAHGEESHALDHDDEHAGSHGGIIVDWGGGKYHLEFVVDHDKKEATVYVLDDQAKNRVAIPVDKLLLSIREPLFTVDLFPEPQEGDETGKSSRFAGNHDNFGVVRDFDGAIIASVAETPYYGTFDESTSAHHHD